VDAVLKSNVYQNTNIGGFNQRQGEALPPHIFLWSGQNDENYCHLMSDFEAKNPKNGTKFDFGWGSAPDPARGAHSDPHTPADPIPAPGLDRTCFP